MLLLLIGKNKPESDLDPGKVGRRIRCPQCQWQPAKHDHWACDPGCGFVWNTFDTAGVCPSCSKRWTETACHRCGKWSPHDAWYEWSHERGPDSR